MTDPDEFKFCPACGTPLVPRGSMRKSQPACPGCGRVFFRDPKVAAAALVEREGKVLLVRRVNVPERGKWSLPAGFVDRGEDPRRAAERECLEETGLVVRVADLLEVVYGAEHPAGADLVLIYRAEIAGGDVEARDDADAAGFFGPLEVPPLAFHATRIALERWQDAGGGILARRGPGGHRP